MRHASSFFSLLLIASTTAFAQTFTPAGSATLVAPRQSEACPVNLFAERRLPAQVARVTSKPGVAEKSFNPLESSLELTFKPLDAPAIAEVYGIVHGPAFGPHIESASTARPGEVAEPFHLHLTPASDDHQQSLLHIHTISNPAWIDLLHITFTDGSRWNASPTSRCRATPNGLLLVSASARQ